jgi:glycosyltransferase involved in cell wall biosynthesis
MNIVFVSKECAPSLRSSGIGTYVWETGRALAQFGHRVTIVAASDDGHPTTSSPSPRVTVIRLPDDELGVENRNLVARTLCAPGGRGIAYRRRVAECIASVIRNDYPDVIEFPGFRGESLMWLCGRRLLPMVVRMHGLTAGVDPLWKDHVSASRRLQVRWERQELRAADVITTVSEHQAQLIAARFATDRVRVVYNSIDSHRWGKLSSEAPQGINPDDILFVGNLLRNKGIFILLRAAKLLRQTGWRGRLLLVGGTTSQFEPLLWLRTALGMKLPDWVVHLGRYQRERLAALYRDAGACCFPSLREAFSYTCLEAMACGGLVIGSSGTGMAEMLSEGCGLLVQPGDVSGLVVALRSALSLTTEERIRIKEAAQQRVRNRFDNSVIIPQLLTVYSEAIDSHKVRR